MDNEKNSIHLLISEYEKETFHLLVLEYGFDYAFKNFLNILYEGKRDNEFYWEFLRYEFNYIETCSLDEFQIYGLANQVPKVLYTNDIETQLKKTIIYNLISKSLKNSNLKPIYQRLTYRYINDLLGPRYMDANSSTVIVDILRLVYKNLICFNNNTDIADELMKSIILEVSGGLGLKYNNTKSLFLINLLIMTWGYCLLDNSISEKHKNRIHGYISKVEYIGYTDNSVSILDIIKSNIASIVLSFGKLDISFFDWISDVDYYPEHLSIGKYIVFSKSMVENLYLTLLLIARISFQDRGELFSFQNSSDEEKLHLYIEFTKMFNLTDDGIEITSDSRKNLKALIKFLNINNENYYLINHGLTSLFEYAKSEARKLSDSGVDVASRTYVIGADQEMDTEFIEKDFGLEAVKSFDNNKFFAGNNEIEGQEVPLFILNMGVNNSSEMNNNVLYSLLDSRLESDIVNVIYSRHLKELHVKTTIEEFKELSKELKTSEMNYCSNLETLELHTRLFNENINFTKLFGFLEGDEKESPGYDIIAINKSRFSFKVTPLRIVRRKLNDEEASKYVDEKVKVAANAYKINDLYYTFEEALEIVKRHYYQDEVHVNYIVLSEGKSGFAVFLEW